MPGSSGVCPPKGNRYVDKSRDHANYSLTVSQTASLTNQPVLIISFSLMPNAVFTSYLIHHDLSMNVSLKKHYTAASAIPRNT